ARAIAADSDDQGQLELQRGRDLSRKIGYEGGLLQLAVAEVFQRMTSSGTLPWPDELEQTAAAQIRRRNGHAYWLDVFDIWAGRSLVPRARWLGGPVGARRRWQRLLKERRRRPVAGSGWSASERLRQPISMLLNGSLGLRF